MNVYKKIMVSMAATVLAISTPSPTYANAKPEECNHSSGFSFIPNSI
ncbi:MAG: hypothetical protein R3Y36_07805 [Spirochaetales bacterium]